MTRWLTLLVAALILTSSPAMGETGIKNVTIAGPSWADFTNQDGTGLYHDIFHAVFSPLNITVTHRYMPSARAYEMIRLGKADMMACSAHEVAELQLANCPMFVNNYHAFFSPKRISPWLGRESLNGRSLVWRRGYYHPREFEDLKNVEFTEHSSGSTALGMVILGRKDAYIDDINLIRESLERCSLEFALEDFAIRPVGKRSYYPLFAKTEHGNTLKALFESRMNKLHQDGTLKKIFRKWNFDYPDYSQCK
ncbi:substrate-binding periplasmic protein [Pseudodesulfovibrio senegalensis]|uniref:Transporter substrate-binding domain-containing protein n=1 Tax=Pseudodesulfovibrio senegalensis TaxID=1721087 RepID=A0A6N6MZH4_9BACT|nr:transporter substrate-binding domain-containing protein [Pseudodesulfovibrio senegalensis]KAB1440338.1 transporter substrate-binding domain-containing protein [Pseudodesulfovibrio senegalensis]